jgi:hypothetical protein
MGELWPVLAPLEALARACPANPARHASWQAFPASAAFRYGPAAAWSSWQDVASGLALQI